MLMFNAKKKQPLITDKLKTETDAFTNAIDYLNKISKSNLNLPILEGVSEKFGIETDLLIKVFRKYLEINAKKAIEEEINTASIISVYMLEQICSKFGVSYEDIK